MKKYKEIQPKKTRIQVAIVCDWCNKENRGRDWTTGAFEVNEIIVSHRVGSCYPEGGSGQKIEVDLCPSCFKKLMEFLEKQGVKIKKEDWGW